jgi:hypothetical protein
MPLLLSSWRMESSGIWCRLCAPVRSSISEECISPILFTLIKEKIRSSEPSVLTWATRRHIPQDGILHSHRRDNQKSYTASSYLPTCLYIRLYCPMGETQRPVKLYSYKLMSRNLRNFLWSYVFLQEWTKPSGCVHRGLCSMAWVTAAELTRYSPGRQLPLRIFAKENYAIFSGIDIFSTSYGFGNN